MTKHKNAPCQTLVHALFVLFNNCHVLPGNAGNILMRYNNRPPSNF